MKPKEDDFVLTDLNHRLFDAGQLTEKWKNESREVLEGLLRKYAKFHQAEKAIKCLLDEIDRREQAAGRTEAVSLAAALERRVALIEQKMPMPPRSEWKTWAFWMALIALLIAGWALLRDYFGWQHPPAPNSSSGPPHRRLQPSFPAARSRHPRNARLGPESISTRTMTTV